MITIFVWFSPSVHSSVLNTEGRELVAGFFMVCIQESHTHTIPLPDTDLLIYFYSKHIQTHSVVDTYILPFLTFTTWSSNTEHDQQFQAQRVSEEDEKHGIDVSSLSLFCLFFLETLCMHTKEFQQITLLSHNFMLSVISSTLFKATILTLNFLVKPFGFLMSTTGHNPFFSLGIWNTSPLSVK